MSNAAAFQATYSDWKLIRTRKVVQLVFEVPVEQAGLAYEVLNGMPDSGSEVWCAVARLDETKESATKPRPAAPHKTGGAHSKSWHEMTSGQQAGVLCADKSFQKFLTESYGQDATDAAAFVRRYCEVESRSDIDKSERSKFKWRGLTSGYRGWMKMPEVLA